MSTEAKQQISEEEVQRNHPTLLPNGLRVLEGEELLIVDFLDRFKQAECLVSLAITKKMAKTILEVMENFVSASSLNEEHKDESHTI